MSIKNSITGLCVGVAILLGAAGASAGVTSYPGSLCVQTWKVWNTVGLYYFGPEITTITNSTVINCPISQQGHNITAAYVSGHIYGQTVTCSLLVRDKFNDSGFTSSGATNIGVPAPKYTLDLHPFAHFFSDGTKSVSCTLPASSVDFTGTVSSYTITED